jgi:hypothetical protein
VTLPDFKLFLPMVVSDPHTRLGVQIETALDGLVDSSLPYLVGGSVAQIPVYWERVEQSRGVYIWPSNIDHNVVALTGHDLIMGARMAPAWARIDTAKNCSAVRRDCFPDYANFLAAVAKRYHLFAIEIWNEPNVDPGEVGDDVSSYYGCIGRGYESGKYYGEMLKAVYMGIKRANPQTQVLAGALFMGWDTAFIQGMVEAGQFDCISYHAYPVDLVDTFDLAYRKAYLIHGIAPGVPLWLTETSLLSDSGGADFEERQAKYLAYILDDVKNRESQIMGINWYTLYGGGWRNSDLAAKGRKKPAWWRYKDYLEPEI